MKFVDLLFEVDEKSDIASKCDECHESREERGEGRKKRDGGILRDRHAQSNKRHGSGCMTSLSDSWKWKCEEV